MTFVVWRFDRLLKYTLSKNAIAADCPLCLNYLKLK
jgi:hypothetical protein